MNKPVTHSQFQPAKAPSDSQNGTEDQTTASGTADSGNQAAPQPPESQPARPDASNAKAPSAAKSDGKSDTKSDTGAPRSDARDGKPEARKPAQGQAIQGQAASGQAKSAASANQPAAPSPKQSEDHVAPESNPLHRAYWTPRRSGIAALVGVAAIGIVVWLNSGSSAQKVTYIVAPAARGTVTLSVSAKGVLAVADQTDVHAAADGIVASVAVNSGDQVVRGQVLARLTADDARDDLARAQSDIAYNDANLKQYQADQAQAAAEAKRVAFLKAHDVAPVGEYEETQADVDRAVADVTKARAMTQTAQQRVASARAEIDARDVRAPIDGVVLKRSVQPGDSARTHGDPLFTLAQDLSHLKLDVAFPESQLGVLHVGQAADFTVPAFPRKEFAGTLATLDFLPQDSQPASDDPLIPKERVTYKGVLDVANADGMLRPGMTATISLITAQAKDVMVVPDGAFSFVPPSGRAAKLPPVTQTPGQPRHARIWVSEGNGLRPREVVLGLNDGRQTQILQGDLKFGEKIVTGSVTATDNDNKD